MAWQTVPGNEAFRIGELVVDPGDGTIRGPRSAQQLDPKVMDVLLVLARHSGHVVSRDELLDTLWQGRVVGDDAVSRCIYQLRRHMARAGADKRMLVTLPKRGYRLDAEAGPVDPDARSKPQRNTRPWVLAAILAGLVVLRWWPEPPHPASSVDAAPAEIPVIAVLPFVDMSGGGREHVADGIAEELIGTLGRLPELRTIARSSSFYFKQLNLDAPAIAERLGASHVIEGSLRAGNGRTRINVQLIDGTAGITLWSDAFEALDDELSTIHEGIARAVADILDVPFVAAGRHVPDGAAHADVLRARFLLHRRGPGDIEQAANLFARAAEHDPDYVAAWAGLASAQFLRAAGTTGPEGDPLSEQVRIAAARALSLDPDNPEALIRMAWYLARNADFDGAREHFKHAAKRGSQDPVFLAVSAGAALRRGDYDETIRLYREALALDPLASAWRANLAKVLVLAGRDDEGWEETERVLELSGGGNLEASMRHFQVRILLGRGELEAARDVIDASSAGAETDFAAALLYSAAGEHDRAAALIERFKRSSEPGDLLRAAELHAHRGERDEAFAVLARLEALLTSLDSPLVRRNWHERIVGSLYLPALHDDPRWTGWLIDRPWL